MEVMTTSGTHHQLGKDQDSNHRRNCTTWHHNPSWWKQCGSCRYLYILYLGSQFHSWGGSEHEVNGRISISCNCMQMLHRHIWWSMISLSTKLWLYNVYILPVFLHGAETWSITKAIEKRIDAFDQWCLWCILNITWSERVTNFEVHRRTGQPLLLDTVRNRRLKLFGHVARADKSQDHSCALQACISPAARNWRQRPGRPRHTWLRTVEEDLRQFNLGLASRLRRAQNNLADTHGNGNGTDKLRLIYTRQDKTACNTPLKGSGMPIGSVWLFLEQLKTRCFLMTSMSIEISVWGWGTATEPWLLFTEVSY